MTNAPASSDELIEERDGHHAAIVRSAILYTPAAMLAAGLFFFATYNLFTGGVGALIPAVFLGILAFATAYEAQSNLRDLRSEPTVTRGRVMRAWSKGRFFFIGKVHYLMVERRVFEVNPVSAAEVSEDQIVQISHWPHTNTVITLHRAKPEPAADDRERGR